MPPQGAKIDSEVSVFLNVPFDAGYERMFVALIATTVAARLTPRCAVELPERGEGQFGRIVKLIETCPLSIHDLSRAGQPARFNMPFELGISVVARAAWPAEEQLGEASFDAGDGGGGGRLVGVKQ